MLNFSFLMGRITAAPELKYSNGGTPLCKFSLAVERNYAGENGQRETDFIDCVAWRTTAEFISKYFDKGSLILLVGSIRQNRWTAEDGSNRSKVEFVVNDAHFTGERRDKREEQPEHGDDDAPPPSPPQMDLPAAAQAFADKWRIRVEDGDLV